MARILLQVINVICGENLALFTVTNIHSIQKSTKDKLQNKIQPKMKSNRKFKVQTGQQTEKSSWWIKAFNTRLWLIYNAKVI